MSASYEEALSELSQLPPGADLDQADKYRALCLLGLNRPQEATESIDRLIKRRPLLKVDERDSPKLVLMYRDAQARLLPGAARTSTRRRRSTSSTERSRRRRRSSARCSA
jgi:hypothetical protein